MSQILDKLTFNLLGDEYVLHSTETFATTYSDLKSKRDHSELIPGMWYRITDYHTTTTLENTSSADHPFEILVQALTENTLSEDAKAYVKKYELLPIDSLDLYSNGEYVETVSNTYARGNGYFSYNWGPGGQIDLSIRENYQVDDRGLYIQDKSFLFYFKPELEYIYFNNLDCARGQGYFNNSNLSAWELKYCLDNDTSRFSWALEGGCGVIYYMKDEFGNEANFDFKNLLKNGKYLFDVDGEDGSLTGPVNIINGVCAHAEGYYTIANNDTEHAQGSYNKSNANTLHSVGIGTSESDRKNAFEIANDGKVYIKDVGGYDGTNPSDENDVASALKNVGSSIIHVTYDELVDLQSLSKLIPGQQYRITDYVTTTSTSYTLSTGYAFDIIVLAVLSNKLSEDAKACLCTYNLLIDVIDENGDVCTAVGLQSLLTGKVQYQTPTGSYFTILWFAKNKWISPFEIKGSDNKIYLSADAKKIYSSCLYFSNSKLEAWEIKYSLTNTTTRFAWADTTNGKGVIYYMKDEFGNEAGYDFKNIQFKNLRRFSDSFVSKTNEDKIVDVEALDFSNSNWFTSDSVVMLTESDYKYTFSRSAVDASLRSTCRYNIIENTEDASESATKQYLPFVVLESDTGTIHGNKCLLCPVNIYVHVSGALNHNTFDLHCKNVYICGDHLYESYFSALLKVAFRGYTWDTYIQSCENWVIWSSSHCRNNHFRGVCQKYKIVCDSMQNVHVLGTSNVINSLMPNAYLLAITIYPYSTNITFTGNATWVERFTFMGSNKLTLNIDSGKVYSSIFYPGDYTDKAITEFNRTDSNADTGVTYEYKSNNSTTIMI